jgi:hypothetical protein
MEVSWLLVCTQVGDDAGGGVVPMRAVAHLRGHLHQNIHHTASSPSTPTTTSCKHLGLLAPTLCTCACLPSRQIVHLDDLCMQCVATVLGISSLELSSTTAIDPT